MPPLGKCDSRFCAHDGVGFNDDGELLCEECLAEWVEEEEEEATAAASADDDETGEMDL